MMKLIDILVRELKEWPEDVTVIEQSNIDGELYMEGHPDYTSGVVVDIAEDRREARVTRAQWEVARTRVTGPTIEGVPPDALMSTTVCVNELVGLCHHLASRSGWWTDRATGLRVMPDRVNVPEKLCLIHSEISEAMEGHRKDLNDDHLPHRKMLEVELADAMIRIADLAGYLGLDLGGAIVEKLAYNQVRQDHKFENRQKQY